MSKLDSITDYKSSTHVINAQILIECLHHLAAIESGVELRTLSTRKGIKKAAYGVAKVFGHRSSFRDLYIWHPSLRDDVPFDKHIPLLGQTNVSVFYRIILLGRQSSVDMAGGGVNLNAGSALPNQAEIDIRTNIGPKIAIFVSIEMSGPAFINLLGDSKPFSVKTAYQSVIAKIQAKWGSAGQSFGLYRQRDAAGKEVDGEGYRTFRLHNGRAVTETISAEWISGTSEPRGQAYQKQDDGSYKNVSTW